MEHGLRSMLEQLAGNVVEIHQKNCEVICNEVCPICDTHVIINLYRIAQEAVNNAIRHSGAANITLNMQSTSDGVTLDIDDDGCGICGKWDTGSGLGMHTMQYRASMLGATLDLIALPKGGTRVAISLPAQ